MSGVQKGPFRPHLSRRAKALPAGATPIEFPAQGKFGQCQGNLGPAWTGGLRETPVTARGRLPQPWGTRRASPNIGGGYCFAEDRVPTRVGKGIVRCSIYFGRSMGRAPRPDRKASPEVETPPPSQT